MKSKFTLYAIYWLANEWGEEHFNLGRLPFEIAEGVRIEDVSTFILEEAFELVRERNGSEEVKRLRDTQYALVHRYDATTTFANGALIQEDDHDARSEQLIRNIAGCLRLIRPMRQSSSFMQGDVREDGTFDVKTWQSPADLDVPEAHKLFKLYDRDADNLKTYAPEFLKAMVGDIWKFKMAANFHELGYWADSGELLKARYLLWASAIESIYTSHNPNHQGSRVATARIKWFLGENTSIYGPGELSGLADPNITVGSIVDDLYQVRNYIAHGDKIPDRYLMHPMRDGHDGQLSTYGVLFEAQSFIIRSSLLKILRDRLLDNFKDAGAAEVYFAAQGLTKDKFRSPYKKITFAEVQQVFRSESQREHDKFAQDRLMEAEAQFGEWHEYVLSPSDVLQIKLPWNKEFQIPETGMTVAEALQLEEVVKWTAPAYPESHVLLSVRPVIGAVEYQKMTCFDGRLIHMDGIHRLLAWAKSGKPEVKAFVAGNYRLVRRTLDW